MNLSPTSTRAGASMTALSPVTCADAESHDAALAAQNAAIAPTNEPARAARRRPCPRRRCDRAKPRQREAACDRTMRWTAVTLTASSSVLSAVQAVAGARRRPAAQAASLVHVSGCRVGRASFVAGTHRYRRSIKGTAQRHRPARAAIAQRKRALSDDRSYRSHVSLITAHGAGGPLTPSAVTLGTLRRVPKRCR